MADIAVLGLRVDASGAITASDNLGRALNKLDTAAGKSTDSLAKMGAKLAAIGISSAGLLAAVKQGMDFEKQMALIATVTDTTTASVMVLERQLLSLFSSLPVGSLEEMTKGLYDIISAGIPAGRSIEYLGVAAQSAIAGVTSTATAVDALTTVTNAWRADNISAGEAADKMFQAVNKGKITFEELASSIGIIAPVAAAYKIKLEDVLGATAQLTLGGQTASIALTGVRSAITNILNPTAEFTNAFPELAKQFNAAKLEAVGFSQFLIEFNKAVDGNKDKINALFTDIQGKTSVFSLLSDGGAALQVQLDAVANSSGAMKGAFDKLSVTSSAAYQLLKNNLTTTLIELGRMVLPTVNTVLSFFLTTLRGIRDNLPTVIGLVTALGTGFVLYASAARAAAVYTALVGAAQTIAAFVSLARTIRSAADAMALLSIGSKGVVGAVAVLAAMGAGFAAYRAVIKGMEKDQAAFNKELERTAGAGIGVTPPGTTPPGGAGGGAGGPASEAERAAADRVRLAQQSLALAKLETLAAARQVVENRAINDIIKARAELHGNDLKVTLAAIEEERKLGQATVTAESAKASKELTAENRMRVQVARQQYELVGLEGAELTKQIALNQNINAEAEARRTLTGEDLDARLRILAIEYDLAVQGATYNATLERRAVAQAKLHDRAQKYLEAEKTQLDNLNRQMLESLSSGISSVLKGSLNTWQSFIDSIKDLFIKMFSDLFASQVLKKFQGALAGLFLNVENVANPNKGAGMRMATGIGGTVLGSAAIGYGVGGLTSNRGIGFASGAAAGAAFGTVVPGIGNAIGAVVGGIIGGVAGLIGASNNAKKSAEQLRLAQESLSTSLQGVRDSLSEDALGSALANARTEFNKLRDAALQAYAGRKNENGRAAALAEIAALEEKRLKQIKEEYDLQQTQLQQDYEVRRLRATGQSEAADALEFANSQERALADARKSGASAATLAALAETQRAEAAQRAAAIAEAERRRLTDLQIGTQGFTDARGASDAAFAEEQSRRYADAVARNASAAELAAIELYNLAEATRRAADMAEQDLRTRESLVARALGASGDTRGAADREFLERQRQEMADAVRDGMSESNLALLQFTQLVEQSQRQMERAIEDGTKAIREREKNDLAAIDLLIETTKSVGEAQIKAINEQISLVKTTAQAEAKRFEEQIDAVRESTKAQLAVIDTQIEASRSALDAANKQVAAIEKQTKVTEALQQFLDGTKLGELSTLSPAQKLAEARAQFEALVSSAMGGNQDAASRLPNAGTALLDASRAFNASGAGFVGDSTRVNDAVQAVIDRFGGSSSVQEQTLAAARETVETLQGSITFLGTQRSDLQTASEAQLAALIAAKDKAAADAQAIIDKLELQRDKIGEDTQATLDQLELQRTAIQDAATAQIAQLVKVEEEAHRLRIEQSEYWTTFLELVRETGVYQHDERNNPNGPNSEASTSAAAQLATLRESHESLVELTTTQAEQLDVARQQNRLLGDGMLDLRTALESLGTKLDENNRLTRRATEAGAV